MSPQSIYPDCVSSDPSKGIKSLEIPIELADERTVEIVDDGTTASAFLPEQQSQASHSEPHTLSVSSLPPILLKFTLPTTYPVSAPPIITSLHVTNSWFTNISLFQALLLEKWLPGEGVLYNWVEWIRSGDFLRELGLLSTDDTGDGHIRCVYCICVYTHSP